jgi:hypothetical protein
VGIFGLIFRLWVVERDKSAGAAILSGLVFCESKPESRRPRRLELHHPSAIVNKAGQ